MLSAPHIIEIAPAPIREYIENLTSQTYMLSKNAGGEIPYTVIREVVENLIHADFKEPVISILDKGNTIRFSDQGPGISDPDKASLPGYTSATTEMKEYIRGVGSGLPIVKEYLSYSGGSLDIDGGIRKGTVITVSLSNNTKIQQNITKKPEEKEIPVKQSTTTENSAPSVDISLSQTRIARRENQVLQLFALYPSLGPSDINKLIGLSLGTSARTLDNLENAGYLETDSVSRKRYLTQVGIDRINEIKKVVE